ncbi:hypothetical protein ABB37_08241 [Leptomonas pyrrhocoris]|uniref:Uncharacterized protein n=1 Tax=Leptomonas pyrrhocoris TaxID=157538 RepID=A0A0M9FTD0_LEPPY|nr:hypothetical protein ABB37_08241 [Leptomonas pyrrhocoris]KPA75680.1 hypothetical protein ABB37_08241 [Leptomonas pyrrhocoris]|eukprot:XP_015654119.1 hypothetical protein ABB37_08241 [Leptomonas pyrrhocoris]
MSAPALTAPQRYVSHRRLTSPLASTTNGNAPVGPTQLGEAAMMRYAHALANSDGHSDQASRDENKTRGEGRPGSGEGQRRASTSGTSYAAYSSSSNPPPPPPTNRHVGAGDSNSNNAGNSPKHSSAAHAPATPSSSPPSSAEDWQFVLHALRHENRILRQRIEVLISSDVVADDNPVAAGGADMPPTPEVPREVLLRRIARLEAALRLEALERDVVEQRLLAQERVLRAVCTPAPPPPASIPSNGALGET